MSNSEPSRPRQAVLVIHGMGEQKPMDTLRRFVSAVWTRDDNLHIKGSLAVRKWWSKPDPISKSYELRCITTTQNKEGVCTDFYEFYWAYLMQGNAMEHLFAWILELLKKNPFNLNVKLKLLYGAAYVILLLGGLMLLNSTFGFLPIPRGISFIAGVLVIPAFNRFLRTVLGDAARYLHPAPFNIKRRHEIRDAGVNALSRLLRSNQNYDRIIIAGHSLGSVIGYDILNYTWARFHKQVKKDPPFEHTALELLEAEILKRPLDQEAFREAQVAYAEELKQNGNPWTVTDFVTMGSPLTHAEALLAQDKKQLDERKEEREFPTCPPVMEVQQKQNGSVVKYMAYPAPKQIDQDKTYRTPHHGAVFGPTRWTNLYFPSRNILWGDFIGGPLEDAMGKGVKDVALKEANREQPGFFRHNHYWKFPEEQEETLPHIESLREALDLGRAIKIAREPSSLETEDETTAISDVQETEGTEGGPQ